MGYMRAESIMLPLRFIILSIHFIVILAIAFDLDNAAMGILDVNPYQPGVSQATINSFNNTHSTLAGLTYAALACFGIEYITLALGLSIFMHWLTILNIMAHFSGSILTILFYVDNWNLASYIAFITIFNFLPVVVEVLVLVIASRFTYARF